MVLIEGRPRTMSQVNVPKIAAVLHTYLPGPDGGMSSHPNVGSGDVVSGCMLNLRQVSVWLILFSDKRTPAVDCPSRTLPSLVSRLCSSLPPRCL